MINFLYNKRGTGKTRKLIQMANMDVEKSEGDIVFIDSNNKNILNLNHRIRYINAMEYNINNIDTFHGFLCGIISSNYDVEKIYIDGIYNIIDVENLTERTYDLLNSYNITLVISLDSDIIKLPKTLTKYIIS